MSVALLPAPSEITNPTGHRSAPSAADIRRCWGCRAPWPRAAMRWRGREHGPRWNPRQLRVLCCPACAG